MSYILLIEDNQENADLTIRILASAGYEVKHFLRGLEGSQYARKNRPGLILMDFDLPDVNGRTLALVLKKQLGDTSAPPIIAVTARTGDAEKRMAEKFGCAAFVSKPFLPDEFLKLVGQLFIEDKVTTPK
jgi:CheY-like chemotaxis protein